MQLFSIKRDHHQVKKYGFLQPGYRDVFHAILLKFSHVRVNFPGEQIAVCAVNVAILQITARKLLRQNAVKNHVLIV